MQKKKQVPSDLIARIKKGQSPTGIALAYDMSYQQVCAQIRAINISNPNIDNIQKYPTVGRESPIIVHFECNDISEKELIRGYVTPTGKDLVGAELEIFHEL